MMYDEDMLNRMVTNTLWPTYNGRFAVRILCVWRVCVFVSQVRLVVQSSLVLLLHVLLR